MPRGQARRREHRIPRALGALALLAGLAALGLLAYQLWWTDVRAADRSEALVTTLRQDFEATTAQTATADTAAPDTSPTDHEPAIVHLPTLGEELPVLDGVGSDVLDQGVLGRYPGTAGPGDLGNFAVAGHRTTYGRPLWALGELEVGDPVVVETADAYHVYRVTGSRVTTPDDVSVLAPTPNRPGVVPAEAQMVLTTCHPRFSARERLIGYAVLDRSVARAAGPPPELSRSSSAGEGGDPGQ